MVSQSPSGTVERFGHIGLCEAEPLDELIALLVQDRIELSDRAAIPSWIELTLNVQDIFDFTKGR